VVPISTRDLLRFTPEVLKERDGDEAPVFLLKVPSLRDKINIDAMIAEDGARYPTNAEYAETLRRAILENVIYDDQPALLQYIEEFEAAAQEANPIDPDLFSRIEEIARTLRQFSRRLAAVDAQRTRFVGIAMLVRAEAFLMGIEGEGAPALERRQGRLTDACQEAIERRYGAGTLFMIGSRIVELSNVGEDERKNSPSPQPLLPDPETSREESSPPTARRGKSSGNGTTATHV
jgi:hypothetical protein